jgi:hypothetical protein
MEEASTVVEGAVGVREVADATQRARESVGTADAQAICVWTAASREPTMWPMSQLQMTHLVRVVRSQ